MHWLPEQSLKFLPDGKHHVDFPSDFPLIINHYHIKTHNVAPSYHDYLEIAYIYEGQGKFHIRNDVYNVSKGDVVVIGSNEMHNVKPSPDGMKIICMFFMPDLIYRAGGDTIDRAYLTPFYDEKRFARKNKRLYADKNHFIIDSIEKMNKELNAKNLYYQQALKNSLLDLLLPLLRYYVGKIKKNLLNNQEAERLKSVFIHIQKNYAKPISLAQLSKIACMSSSSLCRCFKNFTGTTASNYILRFRIDRAKELLLETDLNISQIAYKVGFEDHSYFNRIFRRFTNMSPTIFRQQYSAGK